MCIRDRHCSSDRHRTTNARLERRWGASKESLFGHRLTGQESSEEIIFLPRSLEAQGSSSADAPEATNASCQNLDSKHGSWFMSSDQLLQLLMRA
eukprot:1784726-Amphidinium_carterae.1